MGRHPRPLPALPPESPAESPRLQLARAARMLREEGALIREVAEALGISRTYAGDLLLDPTGEENRRRHERARGTCADCGGPTGWPGGDGRPERCARCRRALEEANRAGCGTAAAYSRGCRCDACRAAHAARMAEYQRHRYRTDPKYRARRLAAHQAWLESPKGQAYLERRRRARRAAA